MPNIYILHEYYTPSHFNALYNQEEKNRYNIKDYIIISRVNMLKKVIKDAIKTKKVLESLKQYGKNEKKLKNLNKLENQILIVGIAPYNKLMKKYKRIIKKNHSIYFTSWAYWDKPQEKVYDGMLREEYIDILNNSFKGIACVSNQTEKSIKSILNKNLKTIQVRHSIDIENYDKKNDIEKYKFENSKRKIIFLGQLIKRKNVNLIIEWIKQSKEDFEFYFAGEGELKSEITEMEKVDKRVKYIGFLEKKEIKETLKNYDFMILPSKEEPYGIVLIEALASGVPCIVSNAIGPSEIISDGKNGFIIEEIDNIKELNRVLSKSINIKYETYISLSKNCIQSSLEYSKETLIKKWNQLM